MGRRKHPATIAVEKIMKQILEAIGSDEPIKVKNTLRVDRPEPYRELRVMNVAVLEACRGEDKDDIFGIIRASIPSIIGVYEKRYIRGNGVKQHNNAELDGLMIHVTI